MLIGEKVRLRLPLREDAQLISDWYADPAYLGEFYNVWPESRLEWERSIESEVDVREKAMYVIVSLSEDEVVGTIGYLKPFTFSGFSSLEIWYQLHPSARGEGLARQAVCLLVNHLFDAMPVDRVQATVVLGNQASARVAEHAGLQLEGTLRSLYFLHGRLRDVQIYSIVRDDWKDEETYRSGRGAF